MMELLILVAVVAVLGAVLGVATGAIFGAIINNIRRGILGGALGGCIGTIAAQIPASIWAQSHSPNDLFMIDLAYWGVIAAITIGGGVLGAVLGAFAGSRNGEAAEPKETSVSIDPPGYFPDDPLDE